MEKKRDNIDSMLINMLVNKCVIPQLLVVVAGFSLRRTTQPKGCAYQFTPETEGLPSAEAFWRFSADPDECGEIITPSGISLTRNSEDLVPGILRIPRGRISAHLMSRG